MDLHWFKTAKQTGPFKRFYELGDYTLPQKFIDRKDFALVENKPGNLKTKLYDLTKGKTKPRIKHFFVEDEKILFDKRVLSLPDNTYLEGFWQNEKYFSDIKSLLLKDFEPVKPLSKKNREYLKQIKSTDSISLHVRREDYISVEHYKNFHGLMSLDYYKAALELVRKKSGAKNPHIFIMSKDLDWCKENIKLNYPTIFIEGNKSGSDDMRLMKQCNHNILANSSFSWWGAWLNQNPNKVVVAPKNWFQDESANSQIQLPSEWLRI